MNAAVIALQAQMQKFRDDADESTRRSQELHTEGDVFLVRAQELLQAAAECEQALARLEQP